VSEKRFDEPRVGLNRIYTKQGDSGETRLAGGQTVPKDDPRLECYGTIDELNALIGMACLTATGMAIREPKLQPLPESLRRIQHELFNLGSIVATKPEDLKPTQPQITDADVGKLENEIDAVNAGLPPLKSFVLPGGTRLNVELHACRTVCRRAERQLVAVYRSTGAPGEALRYLNRLSDAFFVWSRWVNKSLGAEEILWDPNQAASAQYLTRKKK